MSTSAPNPTKQAITAQSPMTKDVPVAPAPAGPVGVVQKKKQPYPFWLGGAFGFSLYDIAVLRGFVVLTGCVFVFGVASRWVG